MSSMMSSTMLVKSDTFCKRIAEKNGLQRTKIGAKAEVASELQ